MRGFNNHYNSIIGKDKEWHLLTSSYVKIHSMGKLKDRIKQFFPRQFFTIFWLLFVFIPYVILSTPLYTPLAQSPQPTAHLSTPQTDQFPLVKLLLDLQKPDGNFVHGLRRENVQLLENGQPVVLQDFREEHIGIQLVFVINPGDTFLPRDRDGNSFYDLLISNLVEWARRRLGSTIDDLSILVTDGPSRTHLNNPLELFYTLASYSLPPNPTPSLDAALQAVEIAADTPPRPGMKRLVIFITAPLTDDQIVSLKNLQARATEEQVRFIIWLISSPSIPNPINPSLSQFAEQTQGSIILIKKPQDIPNLEAMLAPLRNSYFLSYLSQIKTAGEQRLSAEIHTPDLNITVPAITFNLDLKPPSPAFISPPTEILRQIPVSPSSGNSLPSKSSELQPDQVTLNLLIDFPDGRRRPIELSRLFVDGTIINEIKQPPFDQLLWDLTPYDHSGQHIVQVEVVDQLGLSGKTIEIPVYIKVDYPAQSSIKFLNHNLLWIAISIVLFSAALFLVVLIMGGRLSPASQRLSQRLSSPRKYSRDPLSQTVPIPTLPPRSPLEKPVVTPSTAQDSPPVVHAQLVRLGGVNPNITIPSFPITNDEIIIGKRPGTAQLILDDPSVDALHARLVRLENGRYRLYDSGSLYGTWVNYTPISKEGVLLEDGDLIHFGKVGFRFTTG